jgi:hypothetical protein
MARISLEWCRDQIPSTYNHSRAMRAFYIQIGTQLYRAHAIYVIAGLPEVVAYSPIRNSLLHEGGISYDRLLGL